MNFDILKKVFNETIDLLLPKECVGCSRSGEWVCKTCVSGIVINTDFPCAVCRQPCIQGEVHIKCASQTSLRGLLVASSRRNKTVKEMLRLMKYENLDAVAPILGKMLVQRVESSSTMMSLLMSRETLLVPVPLHSQRKWERGYNQAELLAEVVADGFPIEFTTNIVKRIKKTKTQVGFEKEKRLENLRDAFLVIKPELVKGKSVVLVDDVLTSGATLGEVAKCLKQAGVREVWGLVLSRG